MIPSTDELLDDLRAFDPQATVSLIEADAWGWRCLIASGNKVEFADSREHRALAVKAAIARFKAGPPSHQYSGGRPRPPDPQPAAIAAGIFD